MPYIKKTERLSHFPATAAQNPGQLNYRICREINAYLDQHVESYSTYNDVMGVLACVSQEIYRRLVQGYEEQKLQENGDVFSMQEWERKKALKEGRL